MMLLLVAANLELGEVVLLADEPDMSAKTIFCLCRDISITDDGMF